MNRGFFQQTKTLIIVSAMAMSSSVAMADIPNVTTTNTKSKSIVDTVYIAKWLNNATSAFTFTWDDNNFSHQHIGDILETYGFRGSFFVNPGFANWNNIKTMYAQLSEDGHEIGNHTWSHLNLTTLTLESLINQVNAPINEILDVTGVYPVSFVQPFNASNPTVDSVVFINHLFARIRSQHPMHNRIRRGPVSHHTLADFENWIDESIQNNKWLIIGAHGIDGEGWEPITSGLLHQVCQILEGNQPEIWVGTLKEIAAYEYLKEELIIRYSIENSSLIINILGFDEEKYVNLDSLPFTLLIDVEKCSLLKSYIDPTIEITLQSTSSPDFKQYAVTFDVKSTQSIHLAIESEPFAFNFSGETGYCEDESGVTLTLDGSVSGANYYLMHNVSDTISMLTGNDNALYFENVTTEGTYSVIANDPLTGCWSVMNNMVSVTIFPLPALSIPENIDVCLGEEITLFAEYEHGTLFWSGEAENGVPFAPSQTQIFAAVVVSDFGCKPALGSVTVAVHPLPVVYIEEFEELCKGDYIFALTGGMPWGGTYFVDGEEAIDFIPQTEGQYEILYQYTNVHGCTDEAFGILTVEECFTSIIDYSNQIRIYPNPAKEYIHIDVPFKGSARLINVGGLIVRVLDLNPGLNNLNIQNLLETIYVLEILSDCLPKKQRVKVLVK